MGLSLFRSKYMESRNRADFGSVVIPPQRAVAVAALASIAAVMLLVAALALLPYTRFTTGMGYVVEDSESFVVSSSNTEQALVESILVRDGDLVVPGRSMFLLRGTKGEFGHGKDLNANSLLTIAQVVDRGGVEDQVALALVVSTQRGYVDKFLVQPGDAVRRGQPLAVMVRNRGRLVFRVLVDSRSVAYLTVGRKVHVRIDAYPFQKFGTVDGHIIAMSSSSLSPLQASNMFGITPPSHSRFVVDVAVDESNFIKGKEKLKPGMDASVDFPIEEMSVLQWILGSLTKYGEAGRGQH